MGRLVLALVAVALGALADAPPEIPAHRVSRLAELAETLPAGG